MSKDSDKEFDAIRRALGANPKAAEEWRKQCLDKASRFKGRRKNEDVAGGMRAIEYVAGIQAADAAIKFEPECWLQVCTDPFPTDYFKSEIERLRRCLGVLEPIEERRAKSRQRVRKHRQRQPKGGSLVGSWAKLMYDLGSRSREPASAGFVHSREQKTMHSGR
jgi:hypothetical protein